MRVSIGRTHAAVASQSCSPSAPAPCLGLSAGSARITLRWRQSISPKTSAENDVRDASVRDVNPTRRCVAATVKIPPFKKDFFPRLTPRPFSLKEECRTGKSDKMEIRCRGDIHLPLPVSAKNENGLSPTSAWAAWHGRVCYPVAIFRTLVCGLNAVVDHPTDRPTDRPAKPTRVSRPTPIRGTNKRASCVNEIIQQRQQRMAKFARWSPQSAF